jgi:hypothetical protein
MFLANHGKVAVDNDVIPFDAEVNLVCIGVNMVQI